MRCHLGNALHTVSDFQGIRPRTVGMWINGPNKHPAQTCADNFLRAGVHYLDPAFSDSLPERAADQHALALLFLFLAAEWVVDRTVVKMQKPIWTSGQHPHLAFSGLDGPKHAPLTLRVNVGSYVDHVNTVQLGKELSMSSGVKKKKKID